MEPQHAYAAAPALALHAGTIKMTCSDGSEHTLDAQPGFNPGYADGTGA